MFHVMWQPLGGGGDWQSRTSLCPCILRGVQIFKKLNNELNILLFENVNSFSSF